MPDDDWSVELTRSGGFAGVTLRSQVAADDLAPDERHEWDRLVQSLEELESAGRRSGGHPDSFQYDVTVRRGGQTRRLTLRDNNLTPQAEELVTRMLDRRRRRPDG